MTVEEKINKYINDNGIKISFVADHSNITVSALRNCLKGNRKLKGNELIKICHVLKLDLTFFE